MPRLGVNVDHVATIRQARGGSEPDPVSAAIIAELAGADGIVVHLREDRRHIQERDCIILRQIVSGKLNLEMAPTDEMVKFARTLKPDQATLVPEKRQELTTEGGLDVVSGIEYLKPLIGLLQNDRISVSLFVDPDIDQIKAADRCKADAIEIHTGRYADARNEEERELEFDKIRMAASLGKKLGLSVYAGHGLNYHNVQRIVSIKEIEELNIGHSIVSRAVLVGMKEAVRSMIELINIKLLMGK
ncbi:TPA: pyridoxine 5'-phosphate synthase [bacterium]|nr:pyridoxine 5'-phosphate synthase [bacterium]